MNELQQKVIDVYGEKDYQLFLKAYNFSKEAHAEQKRMSGEPYFIHPYQVADIVIELGLDIDTVCAALLHDVVEDTDATVELIEKEFNPAIATMVDGVTKLSRIGNISKEQQAAESIRKMFLAMAKDIRVIFIKLADRLHNMRTLEYGDREKQIRKATETIEIYAPLAHRLGIYAIKGELEDLCFRYLYPEDYFELKRVVEEHSEERKAFLRDTMNQLSKKIEENNIRCEINGRDKSLYSIYKKMKAHNSTFEQIYDITAIRVLVNTIKDCYSVLGIVHDCWMPIPGRFKDYIAMPKPNMYQSLHTTLIGAKGIPFEVQIRTFKMHRTAEYGISAHWKYKEGKDSDDLDAKLSWLRSLMEWQTDLRDANEFMQTLKVDFFSDIVFVFTPKGDVRDLVKGSTPLDFAYAIHSQIGNKCVGAKVNNRIVPLNHELKSGDIVEIITSNSTKGPGSDWLSIVKTHQAKSKIRQWFKKQLQEEHIAKGKDMLEKECKKKATSLKTVMSAEYIEYVLKKHHMPTIDNIYGAVGYGGLTPTQVLGKAFSEMEVKEKGQEIPTSLPEHQPIVKGKNVRGVIVSGSDDMLIRYSKCCNPLPGDDIVGYITRGRGVSIHRRDCTNLSAMDVERERFIDVAWADENNQDYYIAQIQIHAVESKSIYVVVTKTINDMDIEAVSLSGSINKNKEAVMDISVKIKTTKQLNALMKKLRMLPDVVEVFRVGK